MFWPFQSQVKVILLKCINMKHRKAIMRPHKPGCCFSLAMLCSRRSFGPRSSLALCLWSGAMGTLVCVVLGFHQAQFFDIPAFG